MMADLIEAICNKEGLTFTSSFAVSGGDINATFAVAASGKQYLVKINDASSYPQMFAREADGLHVLKQKTAKLKIPSVIGLGECKTKQYLLLEWLEQAPQGQNFWNNFGAALAALHSSTNDFFGWPSSNYIGSLLQQNDFKETWGEFYASQRLLPLVEILRQKKCFDKPDVKAAENLCKRLNEIFPQEPPALLHGDLWSGNVMAVYIRGKSTSIAAIYDPAVYYGHREMDLGMSLLFGGFDKQFYESYNSVYPLQSGWKKRVLVAQLYPLLVHAVLFGSAYTVQCKAILSTWKNS